MKAKAQGAQQKRSVTSACDGAGLRGRPPPAAAPDPCRSRCRRCGAYDANGDYARDVLFSWAGSDHQKQMMREYPREHLLMDLISRAPAAR